MSLAFREEDAVMPTPHDIGQLYAQVRSSLLCCRSQARKMFNLLSKGEARICIDRSRWGSPPSSQHSDSNVRRKCGYSNPIDILPFLKEGEDVNLSWIMLVKQFFTAPFVQLTRK